MKMMSNPIKYKKKIFRSYMEVLIMPRYKLKLTNRFNWAIRSNLFN